MPGEPTRGSGGSHGHPDLVESGPPVSAARRRLLACLVVVLAIVGSLAWYLDGHRRAYEFTALLECVATAESAWGRADAQVTAMASYVRPSVGSGPSLDVQRGLYRLVAAEAASGEPAVRHALALCRAVSVLPFHPALRKARTAYVACLLGEVDGLTATASDGSRAFASSDRLTQLRARALAELSVAAPDDSAHQRALRLMDRGRAAIR